MICHLLSSSRIFEQLLDVTGESYDETVKMQFTKTLRKVGVYREGIQMIYDEMKQYNAGRKIQSIEVVVIPSPDQLAPVICRQDRFKFIMQQGKIITGKNLNITKARLQSITDLSNYEKSAPTMLHAELSP
jgi:hypothetical protein